MTRVNEMTSAYSAMKKCYGRASTADDLITIGDIIVNASDITAVGFRINPAQISIGIPEPTSDNEDTETK